MSMGALNSDPTFVAMMNNIQDKWVILSKEGVLAIFGSKRIVYDILLHVSCADKFLTSFCTVLGVLKHHRATIKLKIQCFCKKMIFWDGCGDSRKQIISFKI